MKKIIIVLVIVFFLLLINVLGNNNNNNNTNNNPADEVVKEIPQEIKDYENMLKKELFNLYDSIEIKDYNATYNISIEIKNYKSSNTISKDMIYTYFDNENKLSYIQMNHHYNVNNLNFENAFLKYLKILKIDEEEVIEKRTTAMVKASEEILETNGYRVYFNYKNDSLQSILINVL